MIYTMPDIIANSLRRICDEGECMNILLAEFWSDICRSRVGQRNMGTISLSIRELYFNVETLNTAPSSFSLPQIATKTMPTLFIDVSLKRLTLIC